jgi:hypothetical protein
VNPKENHFAHVPTLEVNSCALTNGHSVTILKIKEKLLALKKHKKDIKFVWIPAHMGIVLTEIADVSTTEVFEKVTMFNA